MRRVGPALLLLALVPGCRGGLLSRNRDGSVPAADAPPTAARSVAVPDLRGRDVAAAARQLEAAGLVVGVVEAWPDALGYPAGTVVATAPMRGTSILAGTSVDLRVYGITDAAARRATAEARTARAAGSSVASPTPVPPPLPVGGSAGASAAVPGVVGLDLDAAADVLRRAGFPTTYVRVPGTPAGVVLAQDVAAGTLAARGTPMRLRVARGDTTEVAEAPPPAVAESVPDDAPGFAPPPTLGAPPVPPAIVETGPEPAPGREAPPALLPEAQPLAPLPEVPPPAPLPEAPPPAPLTEDVPPASPLGEAPGGETPVPDVGRPTVPSPDVPVLPAPVLPSLPPVAPVAAEDDDASAIPSPPRPPPVPPSPPAALLTVEPPPPPAVPPTEPFDEASAVPSGPPRPFVLPPDVVGTPAPDGTIVVPPFLDRTVAQARRIADDAGLVLKEEAATNGLPGRVMDQVPGAGTRVPVGTVIVVRVPSEPAPTVEGPTALPPAGAGPAVASAAAATAPASAAAPATIIVPSVLDRTLLVARRMLEDSGLRVREEAASHGIPGRVMDQMPLPGDRVAPDTEVVLRIPGWRPRIPAPVETADVGSPDAPRAGPSSEPPPGAPPASPATGVDPLPTPVVDRAVPPIAPPQPSPLPAPPPVLELRPMTANAGEIRESPLLAPPPVLEPPAPPAAPPVRPAAPLTVPALPEVPPPPPVDPLATPPVESPPILVPPVDAAPPVTVPPVTPPVAPPVVPPVPPPVLPPAPPAVETPAVPAAPTPATPPETPAATEPPGPLGPPASGIPTPDDAVPTPPKTSVARALDPADVLGVPTLTSPADGATLPAGKVVHFDLAWTAVDGASGYLLEVEETVDGTWMPILRKVVKDPRAILEIEPTNEIGAYRWRVRTVVGRRGGRAAPWSSVLAR